MLAEPPVSLPSNIRYPIDFKLDPAVEPRSLRPVGGALSRRKRRQLGVIPPCPPRIPLLSLGDTPSPPGLVLGHT